MRILILEDDRDRTVLFRRNLIGHDVRIVATATEAIRLLETEIWDALFLDHDLGGSAYVPSGPGTGYEVACWLEEHVDRRPARIRVHSFNDPGRKKIMAALPGAEECPGCWVSAVELSELLS
jgi:CheY-like chemotaxis protein